MQKAARLRPSIERLAKLADFPGSGLRCRHARREFRRMVEEFRVSVFAPELGTTMPVSEKRLDEKWQEVELLCRPVE